MKAFKIFLVLILATLQYGYGQGDSICAVKIGSNFYINCKRIISFSGQPVMTVTNSDKPDILINFDVFSESGALVASIKNGKLTTGDKHQFSIKATLKEFTFIEKSTNRIICLAKKTYNEKLKRCELDLWLDMYMPDGFYFQCTPEKTNVEFLKYISGATFMNSESAINFN